MSVSLPQSVTRFNVSNLTTDLSEVIGATVGIIVSAYLNYKVFSNSQYMGSLLDLVVGIVLLMLFPKNGVINGIGVGMAGYGLYALIKQASNGAII